MLDTKARWFYAGRPGWFSTSTPLSFNVCKVKNSLRFFIIGEGG
jgi:hypothetical protein